MDGRSFLFSLLLLAFVVPARLVGQGDLKKVEGLVAAAQRGDEEAVETLLHYAIGRGRFELSPEAARVVEEGLISLKGRVVPHLRDVLLENPHQSFLVIMELLEEIGDPRVVPVLVAVLTGERAVRGMEEGSPRIRAQARAAQALGRIGDARALPALEGAVQEQSPLVRVQACLALHRLGQGRSDLVSVLIETLGDAPVAAKVEAIRALGEMEGPAALPVLIEQTRVEEWMVRRTAASALGDVGGEKAVSVLEELLRRDLEPRVVEAAASALARWKGSAGVPDFLTALNREFDPGSRALRYLSLFVFNDLEYQRRVEEMRVHLVRILGRLEGDEVDEALRDLSEGHREDAVRQEARKVLGERRGA